MNDYSTITHAPTEKCDASPNIRRRLAYHWPAPDPSPTSSRTVCYELLVAASSPFVSSAIEIVAAPLTVLAAYSTLPTMKENRDAARSFVADAP